MNSHIPEILVLGLAVAGAGLWIAKTQAGEAAASVERLAAGPAAAWVKDSSATVLDLRTAEEFKTGHVEGAVNLDFQKPGFEGELAKLDRGKAYLVHCRSGRRSEAALPVFAKLGFAKVGHLEGGITAWIKAGLPVVK